MRFLLYITLAITFATTFAAAGVNPVTAGEPFVLENAAKPNSITVIGDDVIIAEETSIQLYSLKSESFIRYIGKTGNGPGQFNAAPVVHVTPRKKLFVLSQKKLMQFTLDDTLIFEKKMTRYISKIIPIGKKYVASIFGFTKDREYKITIALLDENLKLIKPLHRYVKANPRKRIDMVSYIIDFDVNNGKIYISKPKEDGLIIDVLNDRGDSLYSIEKTGEKVKIPNEYIEEEKQAVKESKSKYWHLIKDVLHFPKYFPSIRSFSVKDGHIFIKTWQKAGKKTLFRVLTVSGQTKPDLYLPESGRLYTINNGRYYFLKENVDEEQWELHSRPLDAKGPK